MDAATAFVRPSASWIRPAYRQFSCATHRVPRLIFLSACHGPPTGGAPSRCAPSPGISPVWFTVIWAKAMGAPNSYVYKVIMKQAAISAGMGYVLGMIVSVFVVRASQEGGAAILMPLPTAVGMFFLTLAMCVGAALVSINKVTRIDPAMVFKG